MNFKQYSSALAKEHALKLTRTVISSYWDCDDQRVMLRMTVEDAHNTKVLVRFSQADNVHMDAFQFALTSKEGQEGDVFLAPLTDTLIESFQLLARGYGALFFAGLWNYENPPTNREFFWIATNIQDWHRPPFLKDFPE